VRLEGDVPRLHEENQVEHRLGRIPCCREMARCEACLVRVSSSVDSFLWEFVFHLNYLKTEILLTVDCSHRALVDHQVQ